MAKMFYTTEEAAQKLGVSGDQLKTLVSESKLREFRDGARVMFKVDQVDKLASDRKAGSVGGTKAGSGGPLGLADSGISLSGDSHASDVISLADSTAHGSPSKDDTVVTGAMKGGSASASATGQQVFKPGEVKSADTGAQTKIQSAIDDQLSLEGVGSGSGLLDLTRESDDTSLGAELLDEIYPGGDSKGESGIGSASGIFVEQSAAGGSSIRDAQSPSGLEHMTTSTAAPMAVADMAEPYDPSSSAFGGLAFASVIVSILTAIIALSYFAGFEPSWVGMITQSTTNALIFGGALAVIAVIMGVIGMIAGRSAR